MSIYQSHAEIMNKTPGNLHLYDGYYCSICSNKGIVYSVNEKDDGVVSRFCTCRKVRKSLRLLRESGLENFIKEKTFDSFRTDEDWQDYIKRQATGFCQDDKAKWFFIGGQCGCGKTHICTAICSYYLDKGVPTRYMEWNKVSKRLKAAVNEREYLDILDEYISIDLLYIDDFLKVKKGSEPTSADVNIAFDILNSRLTNRDCITIISSEFTLNQLLENVDEGAMSRISERAKPYIVNISADSDKNIRTR